VHHKPLPLSNEEFSGEFVYSDDPSAPRTKFRQTEAWYLDVKPEDLDKSKPGPCDPEIAQWFVRQADHWPLDQLLAIAVFQLCEMFQKWP